MPALLPCMHNADESSVVDKRRLQLQKSLDKYVGILCEARKKKGLTEQQARDSLQDINVYGTLMVLAGDADGMVSGATSTTANTIRPALQVSPASPCGHAYCQLGTRVLCVTPRQQQHPHSVCVPYQLVS